MLNDVARDALELAAAGLRRRAKKNAEGEDETKYLAPLWKIVDEGRSAAQGWSNVIKAPGAVGRSDFCRSGAVAGRGEAGFVADEAGLGLQHLHRSAAGLTGCAGPPENGFIFVPLIST